MLAIFQKAADNSNKHRKYQFWQSQYHPVALLVNGKQFRCLDYTHQNLVKAGMVAEAEHYRYSSALDYAGRKGLLLIKFIE